MNIDRHVLPAFLKRDDIWSEWISPVYLQGQGHHSERPVIHPFLWQLSMCCVRTHWFYVLALKTHLLGRKGSSIPMITGWSSAEPTSITQCSESKRPIVAQQTFTNMLYWDLTVPDFWTRIRWIQDTFK
jgi:hypothetical protein